MHAPTTLTYIESLLRRERELVRILADLADAIQNSGSLAAQDAAVEAARRQLTEDERKLYEERRLRLHVERLHTLADSLLART